MESVERPRKSPKSKKKRDASSTEIQATPSTEQPESDVTNGHSEEQQQQQQDDDAATRPTTNGNDDATTNGHDVNENGHTNGHDDGQQEQQH
jgi:hypothetical protein